MKLGRRSLFKGLMGLAASPVLLKVAARLEAVPVVRRAANAYVTMVSGAITAITITNGGSGYTTSPVVVITNPQKDQVTQV